MKINLAKRAGEGDGKSELGAYALASRTPLLTINEDIANLKPQLEHCRFCPGRRNNIAPNNIIFHFRIQTGCFPCVSFFSEVRLALLAYKTSLPPFADRRVCEAI